MTVVGPILLTASRLLYYPSLYLLGVGWLAGRLDGMVCFVLSLILEICRPFSFTAESIPFVPIALLPLLPRLLDDECLVAVLLVNTYWNPFALPVVGFNWIRVVLLESIYELSPTWRVAIQFDFRSIPIHFHFLPPNNSSSRLCLLSLPHVALDVLLLLLDI